LDLELCRALVALYGPGTGRQIMFDDAVIDWDIRIGQRKGSVLGRARYLLKAAGVSSHGLPTARRSSEPDKAA
jgi:hypothetical protein